MKCGIKAFVNNIDIASVLPHLGLDLYCEVGDGIGCVLLLYGQVALKLGHTGVLQ
jgi:hypothetical protein